MRWSIIRLIWVRELRDQLRDRRTILMIAVLPILLYPIAGVGLMQLALGFLKKQNVIGVVGKEYLPTGSPRAAVPFLTGAAGVPLGVPVAAVERASAAAVAGQLLWLEEYPPLFVKDGSRTRFLPAYVDSAAEGDWLALQFFDGPAAGTTPSEYLEKVDRTPLDSRQVDVLLVVPPNFAEQLRRGERPVLHVLTREGDDRSRLVNNRFASVLARWKRQLKDTRLARHGLPRSFDDPFEVRDPERAKPEGKRAADDLFELLVRVFPFILVMWALAGALYPAVDLCAGEKERGTMETLLISPASREEIVWGKFLTIWVFSTVTALLNLLSMGLTTWKFSTEMPNDTFHLASVLWGVILLLPLSAFFSALCLAVGVYARSSKEGQYYLMPLFLMTMPLIFLTLAPGVVLNPFYSMVPVTGVALLLQELMKSGTPSAAAWGYFLPVLAPMVIYSWLALRWAIEQFQREEVLFREADRLDLGLWLKRLFREKEPLPSTSEALFCFGLILGLTWLSLSAGSRLPSLISIGVGYLAFVAAPPLLMAVVLTGRPWQGLGLRRPPLWSWAAAALLAALLFLPGAELTAYILQQYPGIKDAMKEAQETLQDTAPAGSTGGTLAPRSTALLLGLALLQAVCEELAFRGFILSGLLRRFRPRTAVFLSSFLFALFNMNVFQFIPHFLTGVVLGMLVVRSGSVLPSMVFHFVYNALIYFCLVLAPMVWPESLAGLLDAEGHFSLAAVLLGGLSTLLAGGVLLSMPFLGRRPVTETEEPVEPERPRPMPAPLARQPSTTT
jgi:sodium transport system permease protein